MAYDNSDKKLDSVYSKRIKAGKRRTYFFDVRSTRGNDYFLTITESRKRFNDDGYDRHKIFLYKEDFNKFMGGLEEAVNYVKTELLPDFDFDAFRHDEFEDEIQQPSAETSQTIVNKPATAAPAAEAEPDQVEDAEATRPGTDLGEVDKW